MKHRLLTSTAVGALLATSSYVYADGLGLRMFGGLNFLDGHKFGITSGGGTRAGTKLRSSTFGATTGFTSTTEYFGTSITSFGQNGELDPKNGFVFGAAVGYQWDNGLSVDLEMAYRRNNLDLEGSGFFARTKIATTKYRHNSFSSAFSTPVTKTFLSGTQNNASGEGHINAYSLLANVWYEFNLGNSQWKPYVGGGVGMAWVDLDVHGRQNTNFTSSGITTFTDSTGVSVRGEESGFAWQLGAGIGYEFAPGKQITLDYRYFNGPKIKELELSVGGGSTILDTDYDYDAHNIMLGIKLGI